MRKALPWIYLSLAVLGAVLPWKANLEFIAESGGQAFDLARFVADASSTAAGSLSADLLVGATAVTIWIAGGSTPEDQRLVAGHPTEFRRCFRLRCSVFPFPAGTATPGSGIRVDLLSRHVDRHVTGGKTDI